MPGISTVQSTLRFSSLNASNEHPWVWEISQHESPGCTQYSVVVFGHVLTGGDRPGETIRRHTRRRTTAIMRKNGNKVL